MLGVGIAAFWEDFTSVNAVNMPVLTTRLLEPPRRCLRASGLGAIMRLLAPEGHCFVFPE